MKRLVSVDILRAIAILLMIQGHFVNNLSSREGSSAVLYDLSILLSMLSAPLFSFLAGLCLWLWLRGQTMLGRSELELSKAVMRRGLFLFGAGLAFVSFIWFSREIFIWGVLTMLGASTLILFWLRKCSPNRLVGIALLVLLISPLLRTTTDYAFHWLGDEYSYRFTMMDIVLGFLLHGHFPLLPWIIFALGGFALGKHYWSGQSGEGIRGVWLPVIGLGLASLACLGIIFSKTAPDVLRGYSSGLTFYPASTTYIVGVMGITLLGLWVLYHTFDSGKASLGGAVQSFLTRYSRFSLTAYIVHHAAHIWPLLLLASWEGKSDLWYYYANAMSTPKALLLALLFIGVFYWMLIVLDRRRRYSLERVLRLWSEA